MACPLRESLTSEPTPRSKRQLNQILSNHKALARSLRPGPQVPRTAPTEIFAREIAQVVSSGPRRGKQKDDEERDCEWDRCAPAVPVSIANRLAGLLDVLFDA